MTLLSICIPTRNRANELKITLEHFIKEDIFLSSDDIEIVISDNASEDNTKEICEPFVNQFPEKIRYFRHEQNIGNDNFPFILNQARGKFSKLNNDTCYFLDGKFDEFISIIKDNPDAAAFFVTNEDIEPHLVKCNNSDEFFRATSYFNTWIGGFCVDTEMFKKLENPTQYAEKKLCQVDILGRLINNHKSVVINKIYFKIQPVAKKSGYNVAEVFGKNYLFILKDLMLKKLITRKTYGYIKEDILFKHINSCYCDYSKQFNFYKTGYFKHLLKDYCYNFYFYTSFVKSMIAILLYKYDFLMAIYKKFKK